MYWNIALLEGGLSRWGWAQNSIVVVDPAARTARFTHEYQVLKHVASAVHAGARRLETVTATGYENQLAFVGPDGTVVLVIQNELAEPMPIRVLVGERVLAATLPADSLSTFTVRPARGATAASFPAGRTR